MKNTNGAKHSQTSKFINLKELLECTKEVTSASEISYILGLDSCGEVVKISLANLAILI